jgi:Ribbon-helix-helix protein, copG family
VDNVCHYRLHRGLSSHAHSGGQQSPLDGCSGASQKVIVRTTIYVMTMTRTTVYLPLDAKRRLSAAAHRQHRSEAELIRDAVSRLLAEEPESPRPNPPRFDLDPAVVDHVDEYLSAGFGTAGLEDGLWGA